MVCPPHYSSGTSNSYEDFRVDFSRVVGVSLGFVYQNVPLDHLVEILYLDPLAKRRQLCDLIFVHRILSGDWRGGLQRAAINLVDIRVPGRTRSIDLFWHHIASQPTTPETPPSPDCTELEVLSHRT